MFERMLAGLVVCVAFSVVPLGAPHADARPIASPTGSASSCTLEKKCFGECGCRAGCSVTCAAGEIAKCVPAHEDKGLCIDAKCSCRKQPKAGSGD